MAQLPPYNPRADIAYLAQQVEELQRNYKKLMKAVENATIIDKGEEGLEVVYDISNGNKKSDKLRQGDKQESVEKKPRRNSKRKAGNDEQDTEPGQVQ
jgi:hypothetical protein